MPGELAEDSACQLDGFIQPVAAQAVLEEAEILSGKAFRADATNLDADPPYLVFGRTLLGRDHELVKVRLSYQVNQARLLHDRMGGIWEITSRVNVPQPLSTELKKSI